MATDLGVWSCWIDLKMGLFTVSLNFTFYFNLIVR